MTIPIPPVTVTTTTITASQAPGGTNIPLSSTTSQGEGISSTSIASSQPVSKVESQSTNTAAQLQEIELQIQNISARLKSLRTEREKLESEGTEEKHKEAMTILEQEQILEREHKEALFRQKQISSKQTNTGVVDAKQKLETASQSQPSHKCYKLALRLRYSFYL